MLTQSEIKPLHARESSFLFNALNTIKAVIRRDSEQASQLVQYLSTFSAKLKAAFGVCYSRRRN